jgi:hypothetical protein
MQHEACDVRQTTCDVQCAACGLQHEARNERQTTDMRLTAYGMHALPRIPEPMPRTTPSRVGYHATRGPKPRHLQHQTPKPRRAALLCLRNRAQASAFAGEHGAADLRRAPIADGLQLALHVCAAQPHGPGVSTLSRLGPVPSYSTAPSTKGSSNRRTMADATRNIRRRNAQHTPTQRAT